MNPSKYLHNHDLTCEIDFTADDVSSLFPAMRYEAW